MSTVEPKGYKENPALLPVPPERRLYGRFTFTWMMFSMNTCVPMFFLGVIAKAFDLNVFETAFGAFLGNFAAMVVLILNGYAGIKYGIPYPVQLRPSWGFTGSHIAVILRGIVGAGWYGIEAYSGSLALIMMILWLAGYAGKDPEAIANASFRLVIVILIPYIIAATIVMAKGLRAIATVVNFAGPIMFFYYLWLLYYLTTIAVPVEMPKGAGIFSKGFAVYLAVQTNWWATVCLNVSDLARGLYADKRGFQGLILGPMVGVVIGQVAGSLLGYYLVIYAGYWTPHEIVIYKAPGALAIVLGLLFTFLAPFSTDVTANIPPLMNIFMWTFKLSMAMAAIASGVVAFFVAPWWAVERGPDLVNYVTAFSANYGILLGPIAGIMLADFYILHRRSYDLQKLYTAGPEGYWFHRGFNLSALLSYIITIIIIYIFSWAIGDLPKVGPLVFPTNLSWYPGVLLTFVLHLLFSKYVFKYVK